MAPLARLTLVRLGDAECRLLWTFHHAILDGRGFPVVLREVFDAYDAARAGHAAPTVETRRPFHEYAEWLAARDAAAGERA